MTIPLDGGYRLLIEGSNRKGQGMSLHRWLSVVVLVTAGVMAEVPAASIVPPIRPPVAEPRDTTAVPEAPTRPEKTSRPADSMILAVQPEAAEAAVKPVKILRAEEVLPEEWDESTAKNGTRRSQTDDGGDT